MDETRGDGLRGEAADLLCCVPFVQIFFLKYTVMRS